MKNRVLQALLVGVTFASLTCFSILLSFHSFDPIFSSGGTEVDIATTNVDDQGIQSSKDGNIRGVKDEVINSTAPVIAPVPLEIVSFKSSTVTKDAKDKSKAHPPRSAQKQSGPLVAKANEGSGQRVNKAYYGSGYYKPLVYFTVDDFSKAMKEAGLLPSSTPPPAVLKGITDSPDMEIVPKTDVSTSSLTTEEDFIYPETSAGKVVSADVYPPLPPSSTLPPAVLKGITDSPDMEIVPKTDVSTSSLTTEEDFIYPETSAGKVVSADVYPPLPPSGDVAPVLKEIGISVDEYESLRSDPTPVLRENGTHPKSLKEALINLLLDKEIRNNKPEHLTKQYGLTTKTKG